MPSNVLVFEDSLSGHRAKYCHALATKLLELGANLTLAIPNKSDGGAPFVEFMEPLLDQVEPIFLPQPAKSKWLLKNSKRRLNLLVQAVESSGAKHVYVPYADGLSQAWGLKARPIRLFPNDIVIEGLMMRGSYAYPVNSLKQKFQNWLTYKTLKRSCWTRIHQLDPLVFNFIQEHDADFARRNFLIPDLIELPQQMDRHEACKILGINPEYRYICCPGASNLRKGSDLLLKAFSRFQRDTPDPSIRLLVIGPHDEVVSELLKTEFADIVESGLIVTENRYTQWEEFSALFWVAELVCAPYPRHIGSASVLLMAAKSQKKILASDWGWVGWATTHGLGEVCNVRDIKSFSDLIRKLMSSDSRQALSQGDTGSEHASSEFLQFHSRENHLDHFTVLYRNTFSI